MIDTSNGRFVSSIFTPSLEGQVEFSPTAFYRYIFSDFYRVMAVFGIIAIFVAMTISSFNLRTISLTYDTFGPWPDSFDYTYGTVGLLHGTYDITWQKCPLSGNFDETDTHCLAEPANQRKSYYTPGTSILMLPFVAIGGDTFATLLDYTSVLLIGFIIATVVWRFSNPQLALLAVMAYALSPAQALLSSMAMSDLPTALFLLMASILSASNSRRSLAIAGLLSAYLVWLRPQMAIIAPITILVVLLFQRQRKKIVLFHVVPFASLILTLGVWQWVYYGTPFTTGYQYGAAVREQTVSMFNTPPSLVDDFPSPVNGPSISDFFSPYYLTHHAWHADQTIVGGGKIDLTSPGENTPTIVNWLYYYELLIGVDSYLLPIGVGAVGLFGLFVMVFSRKPQLRAMALIGIYSTFALYATYTFYYYRSGRFFVPIAPLLVIGAAYIIHKLVVHLTHTIKLVLLT